MITITENAASECSVTLMQDTFTIPGQEALLRDRLEVWASQTEDVAVASPASTASPCFMRSLYLIENAGFKRVGIFAPNASRSGLNIAPMRGDGRVAEAGEVAGNR